MAIVYAEFADDLESSIDDEYKREYRFRLQVFTDSRADGADYVRSNVTPPGWTSTLGIYSAYKYQSESDSFSLCKAIRARCVGQVGSHPVTGAQMDGLQWEVSAEFGPWNPFEHTDTGDPTAEPIEVSFEGANGEKVVTKDLNGAPVLNTAGDPFDPPLTRDQARCTIHLAQNLLSVTPAAILGYANAVNSDTWFSFPPRTLKVSPPRATRKWSQFLGAAYWRVEWAFEYEPDGWDKKVLNCGYKQLGVDANSNPIQVPILIDGQPATTPAMLDIDGHYLPPPYDLDSEADPTADDDIGPGDTDGALNTPSSTASPVVYLTFECYYTLDFTTTFGFPSNLFG